MTAAARSRESRTLELRVAKLDCEREAAAITRGLQREAGVLNLKTYPKAAKVVLTFDPSAVSAETLKARLAALGFPAQEGLVLPEPPAPWRNAKVLSAAASGLLVLVGWLLGVTAAPEVLSTGLFWVAIFVGGYYFGREALEELLLEREVGIELLMSVAAIAAALMGEVLEGAVLVFLYAISEAAEGYTEARTRSAVRALMKLVPRVALVRRAGREDEVPVEEVAVGDLFIVKPGQSLPSDGEILKGTSSLDEAPVTGESVPVEKGPGDVAFAGSINGPGALEVRATKVFADNTISRIIHLVEEAQEKRGTSQRFIERFGGVYSPAVLLAGLLIALIPPLFFGAMWESWLLRATVFIVAAAPCALAIAIPITAVAALGTAARQGVLIKGGLYLEELGKVRVVALDKTGTLTKGEPEVIDVILLRGQDGDAPAAREAVLAVAAGLERFSEHPLARAITRYASAQGVSPAKVEGFQSLTGAGATARWGNREVYIGSPELFEARLGLLLSGAQQAIAQLQEEGKTVVVVGSARRAWGLIALRDSLRENARTAVEALYRVGIEKVVMLSGDDERTARAIAKELAIDEVHANLKPGDKLIKVRELNERYGRVAMVGDGVNDAPALAEAAVGIAMGAAGTDVALETADVALMADNLEKLAYAIAHARRNRKVVSQNLALSAAVMAVLIAGAVGGWFTLPIAVLGHEVSEFIVIGSGLRMLRA